MNETKLGQLITGKVLLDAIAVIPMIASQKLYPGQDIGIVTSNNLIGKCDNPIGIVDPYLKGPVYPDQEFYTCLYTQTQ